MKRLKFNHIEAENVRSGIQTATIRLHDDKDLSVNDHFEVIDKVKESDPKTWEIIGQAVINRVSTERLGGLELDGADFEQFGSMTELYDQMSIFYGDPIDADMIVKVVHFTFTPHAGNMKQEDLVEKNTTFPTEVKLYGDGGSRGNPGPSASGFVILDMNDNILETNGEFLNITTNNQAEYHSLKLGLERAHQLGVKKVHVFMDSLLVINQMKGIFKVRNKELLPVYNRVKAQIADFDEVIFTHVPRELNKLADAEVNRILDSISN